jgi:argininosuccinate lyase
MSGMLWGGCFTKSIDQNVLSYTLTTDIDARLVKYDIWGSLAHLMMLGEQNIVDMLTVSKILPSLLRLYDLNAKGLLQLNPELEDVHLNIESLLIQEVGADYGGRLHTARSRNDQVVTDTRMYLRHELLETQMVIIDFVESLIKLSKGSVEKIAVGYTHLQPAQPISLGFWYSAYASMFLRDLERLSSAYDNTNRSVLGACALAGTSFTIDRNFTKELLGFDSLIEHSLDATSSRDFVIQSLAALSIIMSNFSKLAEEMVIWNSHEFGLLEIDDAFATGSSIMPQKKNPVVAELAKGRTGRVFGALMQILTTAKGVTLGYNCDLQEDKPMLWDSLDTVKATANILRRNVEGAKYNSARAEDLCWRNFSTVTELANLLVRGENVPFREAHRITGLLTHEMIIAGKDMRDIKFVIQFLQRHEIKVTEQDVYNSVAPASVLAKQISLGATGPQSVEKMLDVLEAELDAHANRVQLQMKRLANAESKVLSMAKGFLG